MTKTQVWRVWKLAKAEKLKLMTKDLTKATLVSAFKFLTAKQRSRLEHHRKVGTRILCGKNHLIFTSDGAG